MFHSLDCSFRTFYSSKICHNLQPLICEEFVDCVACMLLIYALQYWSVVYYILCCWWRQRFLCFNPPCSWHHAPVYQFIQVYVDGETETDKL